MQPLSQPPTPPYHTMITPVLLYTADACSCLNYSEYFPVSSFFQDHLAASRALCTHVTVLLDTVRIILFETGTSSDQVSSPLCRRPRHVVHACPESPHSTVCQSTVRCTTNKQFGFWKPENKNKQTNKQNKTACQQEPLLHLSSKTKLVVSLALFSERVPYLPRRRSNTNFPHMAPLVEFEPRHAWGQTVWRLHLVKSRHAQGLDPQRFSCDPGRAPCMHV